MVFTKIIITSIGKTPTQFKMLEGHYIKLIKTGVTFCTYDGLSHLPIHEQIKKESSLLTSKISPSDFLIILDSSGTKMSSEKFTSKMRNVKDAKAINFIIGGSYGLSDEIKLKANLVLSLGDLTIPHQLAKIILLEQIYRAETIVQGNTYHK